MRLIQFTCFGFVAFALGGLTAGCSGGQSGDLSGQNDGNGHEVGNSAGCEEQKQKLADFDTQTDAGTAEELLAFAETTFDAPLTWKAEDGSWTVSPESGQGNIHVTVTRGQNAYALSYVEKPDQSGAAIGVICPPPQLGVEAHVTVSTDGGALNESFDTLLRAETAGIGSLEVPLDFSKLDGSLAISFAQASHKLVQAKLAATLTPYGMTGAISGIDQGTSGTGPNSVASARGISLAVWPASEACQAFSQQGDGLGVAVTKSVLGATGNESMAAVTPAPAAPITWMDGTQTTLDVSIESAGDGCFRLNDSPIPADAGPQVGYPVTVKLSSADGHVDGSYAGQLLVSGSETSRRTEASVVLQLGVADLAKTGFDSVHVPAGSEKLLFQLESKRVAGNLSGAVRLFAISTPPCAPAPTPPSDGSGASAPGCAGQTQTQIEGASWSE